MSRLIVEVKEITDITEHPNADRLEIVHIGAWQTCVKKGVFNHGDFVVYIPPDAVLPKALHEYLGITNYCCEMPKGSREAKDGKRRVKATKLRGVSSFGALMTLDDFFNYVKTIPSSKRFTELEPGEDVAEMLQITKYEPPEKITPGDQAPNHPLFHQYTDIERYQNYPNIIHDGEPVVILEKLHGTNCRAGYVCNITEEPIPIAGSHRTVRKQYDANGKLSQYWMPFCDNNFKKMLNELWKHYFPCSSIIAFGEIYGPGIQDMGYEGVVKYRLFDIAVNGSYINWDLVEKWCEKYDVETVPVLYSGPFSKEILMEHTDGPTTVCDKPIGKFKGREGVVVKPLCERYDYDLPSRRVILKSISADYLNRKGGTDNI